MSESVGFTIFSLLVTVLDKKIAEIYDVVMGSWPSITIVTIYVLAVGYMVIMGRTGERTKEWAISALLLATIGGLTLHYDTFHSFFIEPIFDAFYNLASIGASGSAGGLKTSFTSIENSFGRLMFVIEELEVPGSIWSNSWLYFKVSAAAILLALVAAAMFGCFVGLFCIAMFSLLAVTAAGGPCIWLACFKETRFISWTWFKAVLNYGMWLFFLGVVAGIGSSFIETAADEITRWDVAEGVFTRRYGIALTLCGLSVYMFLKASDWAAALTGGSSSNTGIIGAVGSMAGSAMGSVGGAAGRSAWNSRPAAAARGWASNTAAAGIAHAYSALRGLNK